MDLKDLAASLAFKASEMISTSRLTKRERDRIRSSLGELNSAGFDPWGVNPDTIIKMIAALKPVYKHYFRVEVQGTENIPAGRVLLIANHGGQLPLDGIMIGMSLLLDANPPRFARGMVERWAPGLPFVSEFFARAGQVVGDHRNCRDLLEHDQCVLVFPEGVEGSGKTIDRKYQLAKFGTGFLRLSLESKAPIVPIAVIGSEETFPALMNAESFAKLIGAPYFPITPFFPLLGPLGAVPLPCKFTLRFCEPMTFDLDPDASDAEVEACVEKVKTRLQSELDTALKIRGDRIFTGAAK